MKKKYFLIMLLLLIIIFVLFGKERVIFNLDKIRTEYIDDSLYQNGRTNMRL